MLLDKAKDAKFWQNVKEKECYRPYVEELLSIYENEAVPELPALPFADYRRFWEDGDRSCYEKEYFRRRRALNACAILSMMYPEKPEYLARLEDVLFLVISEFSWCVPAHQSGEWTFDHIDLFAAETAWTLSEIYVILGDRLHPLLKRQVPEQVEKRVILPFASGKTKYIWDTMTNNWAAVCGGSVAAATIHLRPDLWKNIRPRIDTIMDHFLSGFGDDGFCTEGIGYWYYGFGFFVCYADLLREFTGGETDLFRLPKVKAIATYMPKIMLGGGVSISFSDGQRHNQPSAKLLHFLHREYGEDVLPVPCTARTWCDGNARWCMHLRGFLWFDENYPSTDVSGDSVCYAPDAQWFIKKTEKYGFAAKAGFNEEFHNHNDVGSFIIASGGKQLFTDLGAGVYDRGYFQAKVRYTYFHASSRSHSVPIFGDDGDESALQQNGYEFKATDVRWEGNDFSFEMAGAYDLPDNVKSIRRTFRTSDTSVTLTDVFDVSGREVTERLVLLAEPVPTENGFSVGDAVCEVSCAKEDITFRKWKATGQDRKDDAEVWIVDCRVKGDTFKLTVDFSGN